MKRKLVEAFGTLPNDENAEKIVLHSAVIEVPRTINAGEHITLVVRGRRDEAQDSLMMEVEISPWSSDVIVHPASAVQQPTVTMHNERGYQIINSQMDVTSCDNTVSCQAMSPVQQAMPILPFPTVTVSHSSSASLSRVLLFNNAIWASHQAHEINRIIRSCAATASAHREGA